MIYTRFHLQLAQKNLEQYLMCTFYYHITDHFWVGAEQPAAPHKNWQEKFIEHRFLPLLRKAHIFLSWVPDRGEIGF